MRDRFSKKEQRENDKENYGDLVSAVAGIKGVSALFKEILRQAEQNAWTCGLSDNDAEKFLKALSIVVKLSKGI